MRVSRPIGKIRLVLQRSTTVNPTISTAEATVCKPAPPAYIPGCRSFRKLQKLMFNAPRLKPQAIASEDRSSELISATFLCAICCEHVPVALWLGLNSGTILLPGFADSLYRTRPGMSSFGSGKENFGRMRLLRLTSQGVAADFGHLALDLQLGTTKSVFYMMPLFVPSQSSYVRAREQWILVEFFPVRRSATEVPESWYLDSF